MKKQQAEDIAKGPAVSMSIGRLYRAIIPKRRWRVWGAALALSCSATAVFWLLRNQEFLRYSIGFYILSAAVLVPPVLSVLVPAVIGPIDLAADVHAGRLEQMCLTTLKPRHLLQAYHRRTFRTVLMLLFVLVPCWVLIGRSPMPFLFVNHAFSPDIFHPAERVQAIVWSAAGFMVDVATAFLAASLGLSFFVLTKNRPWSAVLGLAGFVAFFCFGVLVCETLVVVFEAAGVAWLKHPSGGGGGLGLSISFGPYVTDPGYSLLLWSFAIPYSVLAYLLGRLTLRLVARRLDRLVTD